LERELIYVVSEFVRMARPLESVRVLRHFASHPWFDAPVPGGRAAVILGTTSPGRSGAIPLSHQDSTDGFGPFAVESCAMLPQGVSRTSATPDPASVPKLPSPGAETLRVHGWGPFIPASEFENDQDEFRKLLRLVWCWGPSARADVTNHIATQWDLHPDLVRAAYDPNQMSVLPRFSLRRGVLRKSVSPPRRWLATVRGACLLAMQCLVNDKRLRNALRYCVACDVPWFPRPSEESRGRPAETCATCGGAMPSHGQMTMNGGAFRSARDCRV
jgi:hypothetical protein